MELLIVEDKDKAEISKEIFFGFLPQGKFIYPLSVIVPYKNTINVTLFFYSNLNLVKTEKLVFSSSSTQYDFEFEISEKSGVVSNSLVIIIEEGEVVKLYLPVSPRILVNDRIRIDNSIDWYELEDEINSEINALEEELQTHTNFHSKITRNNVNISMNKDQIDAYIKTKYFRGLLNLNEAQKQMDFVVYNKILLSNQKNGFKRKCIRRMLIFFYRIVTKSPSIKNYLAKLYRNYVNNNLIAENLHCE
jgi:hypothetical protein